MENHFHMGDGRYFRRPFQCRKCRSKSCRIICRASGGEGIEREIWNALCDRDTDPGIYEESFERIRLPALEDRGKENLQGTGNSEKIITLIGEPVTTTSLAALIEKEYHYKTKVLCPLEETDGLIGSQDLKVSGEEEMENALKNAQIVVADPLYRPICPAECEFYERAHIAFSGRMFLKNK